MQSPGLQDHPWAAELEDWGINSVQNPQTGLKRTQDLRNSWKSPCVERAEETSPVPTSAVGHRHCQGLVGSCPMASVLAHPFQNVG